jgi:hypothetical protein
VAIHEAVPPLEAPRQVARLSGLPRFARNDEGLGDWRESSRHCDTANTRHCEAQSAVAIHAAEPSPEALGQAEPPCGLPRACGLRNDEGEGKRRHHAEKYRQPGSHSADYPGYRPDRACRNRYHRLVGMAGSRAARHGIVRLLRDLFPSGHSVLRRNNKAFFRRRAQQKPVANLRPCRFAGTRQGNMRRTRRVFLRHFNPARTRE